METKTNNKIYCPRYDSYYDESADVWLEHTCEDSECDYCKDVPEKPSDMSKCALCSKIIDYDMEGDIVHLHLEDIGVDSRLCDPSNPDSDIARFE
jgi:hypothetical protein